MSMEQRKDMKFAGTMTVPGGLYKRVTCAGAIIVDGDIDCLELKVNGNYSGNGSMKATNAVINGGADIGGDLKTEDFRVFGQAKIGGGISGGVVRADGKLVAQKGVKVDRVVINGEIDTRGDCEAETFICAGSAEIEGALNAGDVSIKMYGPVRIGEIGGEKIAVHKGHESTLGRIASAVLTPLGLHDARLVAETIEGDEIYLEHTSAKVVRGGRVTIGKGCEIDRLEYRTDYKACSGTSVLQHVKI